MLNRAQPDLPDAAGHRRRTRRQARHEARVRLRTAALDAELLEDADALCPKEVHDLGRHTSPARKAVPKDGRRGGFKVWKTPYWKRRKAMRAARNARLRSGADI
ncbi:MAG TPA: hypothetical protein VKV25_08930 [Acidimicrobiales bacterium]|nr:hypothetical protein [Acidimicrobiales bacterium]